MQPARFRPMRFQPEQRFWLRHLIDQDLVLRERLLRNAMARLDNARLTGHFRCGNPGNTGEEATDRNRIGCIIRALVNHLQHIIGAEDGGRHLNAARTPTVRQRHFACTEGNLVSRDRDGLQDGAADHTLCRLIQIGEVVAGFGHSAASRNSASAARRMVRRFSNSLWKST